MTETTQQQGPVLVLGGTGKTGRRIAQRLMGLGVPVRIGSRSGTPPFDWEDPNTWAAALRGSSAVYISFYPDLAVPGTTQAIRELVALALQEGVRRLVLLSGRGEEEAQACEQIVRDSGADWTILRCAWFAQNFDESYLVDPVAAGEVALPVGDVGEPFVDAEDIADVAVAALTQDGHVHEIYELTGPRLLTFAEAVAEIGAAAGRDIRYVEISADDFAAGLAAEGIPGDVTEFLRYLFTTVLDGRNEQLTDGVRRALGRPPRDFAEYAKAAAATGVWAAR